MNTSLRTLSVLTTGILLLLLAGCCRKCRTENVVIIDFEAAELMIDWLDLAASGTPDADLRNRFIDTVAPSLGCQAIIRHWARFREWDEDIFYDFIREATGLEPTDQPLADEAGVLTSFGKRRELWSAALADPDRLRENERVFRR